jgi:trimeric autotransporter adhesin
MRHVLKSAATGTLFAASLLSFGCGSDDEFFNPGPGVPFNPIGLQAPVAVNDNFTVAGNGQLTVAVPGVLGNDTPNTAVPTLQTQPTRGTVNFNQNGSFVYTPNAGQSNVTDTFTYNLNNGFGSSTATVTIQIGAQAFFVNNQANAGGTGSQAQPFNTLGAAVGAATGVNGAQIVVFRGSGTSTGQNTPVTLGANQSIVAQDPANPPTISAPITLANNTTLSGLRLVGTTGGDAVIGTGVSGVTLTNLLIDQTVANGVNLTNPSGTVTMNNLTFSNIGRAAFPLSVSAGTLNLSATNWTVTNTVNDVSIANVTGTGAVNATYSQMTFSQIAPAIFGRGYDWTLRNTANSTLRVSDYRFDTGGIGVVFTTADDSRGAVIVANANVTNGTGRGLDMASGGTSVLKTRITNSRLLNNLQGVSLVSVQNSNLFARLSGNTSDSYRFIETPPSTLLIENLNQLLTENTQTVGPLVNQGAENAPLDSLQIP